jgi:hypothetical protein
MLLYVPTALVFEVWWVPMQLFTEGLEMKDPFSADDPCEEWPDEVKRAYESLKIPSVYDAVLANEKLSLEIHRQNRSLKEVLGAVQAMSIGINTMMQVILEDERAGQGEVYNHPATPGEADWRDWRGQEEFDYDRESVYEVDDFFSSVDQIMIEAADVLIDLAKTTKTLTQELSEVLPQGKGEFAPIIKKLTWSLTENLDTARYRFIARLQELEIDLIDPSVGEAVILEKHHVVDKIPGGEPGTIAKIIRNGYQQNEAILRRAEVIIYR